MYVGQRITASVNGKVNSGVIVGRQQDAPDTWEVYVLGEGKTYYIPGTSMSADPAGSQPSVVFPVTASPIQGPPPLTQEMLTAAVFKGTLLSGFVFFAIGFVLGLIALAINSSH
jgi:hypothetical protein